MKFTYVLVIFLTLLSTACTLKKKFNRELWNLHADPAFPPKDRNAMVDDLLNNYTLKGLTSRELRRLIGEPDFTEPAGITYNIIVDYGRDIDPVQVKNLIFDISSDSLVTGYRITEYINIWQPHNGQVFLIFSKGRSTPGNKKFNERT